jgi:hypothetical protein
MGNFVDYMQYLGSKYKASAMAVLADVESTCTYCTAHVLVRGPSAKARHANTRSGRARAIITARRGGLLPNVHASQGVHGTLQVLR